MDVRLGLIKKAECRRIDAFELWFCRRLLRVPWTARRSNQSFLKDISPEYSLKGLMLKLKLWMALPTRCTWVWVSSRSWWGTGKPGVLQPKGLQRVGLDWVTELNWSRPLPSTFFSCPQSSPVSGYFPMSQLSASGGQNIGALASVWALPMNIQDWYPLGLAGLISLPFQGFIS